MSTAKLSINSLSFLNAVLFHFADFVVFLFVEDRQFWPWGHCKDLRTGTNDLFKKKILSTSATKHYYIIQRGKSYFFTT
jgi:hypothetical protein